jgi:hypothetical protein
MAADDRPPLQLHDGEADIDAGLVRRLVAAQVPDLRAAAAPGPLGRRPRERVALAPGARATPAAGGPGAGREGTARELARFVAELRRVDPAGAPRAGRAALRELDAGTRAAIASARDVFDAATATAAWERALWAPAWSGPPVWIHGDPPPT